MLVLRSTQEVRAWCSAYRAANLKLGLVPTMGALHEGHLALIRTARAECERVVVSIFVNPLQFCPGEDLENYPRPFERDRRLCEKESVDILYHGVTSDFYPDDFRSKVSVSRLTEIMCGPFRPGHFDGVCTVVTKLLLRTLPHVAYFGQKDYQQAVVIKRMIRDLDIPTELRMVPTVREPDGVAMSSRNAYLNAEQRQAARCLWRGLSKALELHRRGERRAGALVDACREEIEREPGVEIEYVELADAEELGKYESEEAVGPRAVLAVAARIGNARLIDNVLLHSS